MAATADIALIGLAVMGQNLVLNMNDHGFVVCVFNRTVSKVNSFLANEAKDTNIIGAQSLAEMVGHLKKPRKVMLLVKAGDAVDAFIKNLVPLLERGDIIIDGGNSEFTDSIRRAKHLEEVGLLFVGSGVSGGEDGARYGPSMMPGGSVSAWPHVKPIFQSICAKVGPDPCCDWLSSDGSGHYVKMVHNGIEYGDMQLICEAYDIMRQAMNMSHDEMSRVFKEWNASKELDSFLMEISTDILAFKDDDGEPLITKILDSAGQKGTGKWTAIAALESGTPVTLIGESVFARCLSSLKKERVTASNVYNQVKKPYTGDSKQFLDKIKQALYASKIISYAQGFMLLREASKMYGWQLDYGSIALMWRGGCIIRSRFLGNIKDAFDKDPALSSLLLDDFFKEAIKDCEQAWRDVVCAAIQLKIPTPCFATALAFFDGYTSSVLPANMIQAQRDYFGAHTYERLDNPGVFVHNNWTGHGGNVSSSTYNA